jgi:F-type H+-transporting ATPase subunit b
LKKTMRFLNSILIACLLLAAPVTRIHAQDSPSSSAQASPEAVRAPNPEHEEAKEAENSNDEYRHSGTVSAIARFLHVSTETAAQIFEDINSGFLIFVMLAVLVKVLPGMFRKRSETLQKDLSTARTATEDANRRLAEVEARLSRLDTEIEAIRAQAERDTAEDEKRIHAALEAERERIVSSAEQEIAAAQAAAQRELKKFAADLAIDSALRRMQLSAETDRALVRDFSKRLNGPGGKA